MEEEYGNYVISYLRDHHALRQRIISLLVITKLKPHLFFIWRCMEGIINSSTDGSSFKAILLQFPNCEEYINLGYPQYYSKCLK